MAVGVLVVDLDPGVPLAGYRQPLAGFELWSSRRLGHANAAGVRPRRARVAIDSDWRPVYEGPSSELEGAPKLAVWRGALGQRRVDFDDGERFLIAADGATITRARPAAAPSSEGLTEERALGAPLALALALRGRFLLHASAVVGNGRAMALTARSGVGKSTLAAFAARASRCEWTRVADDILPVELDHEPLVLPHFPQLKLSAAESYPGLGPPTIPLVALVELDRREPAEAQIAVDALAPSAAALALARATVAARLFDGELLERHLVACARAARRLRVVRLRYPSGLDRLGAVLARLGELV